MLLSPKRLITYFLSSMLNGTIVPVSYNKFLRKDKLLYYYLSHVRRGFLHFVLQDLEHPILYRVAYRNWPHSLSSTHAVR
jgi:hypothetical protein